MNSAMSVNTPKFPPPPPPPPQGGPTLSPTNVGRPSQYWPLSIISFLLSFVIGGIALYFSWQVADRWTKGDAEGALKASKTAKTVAIIGIVIGGLAFLYYMGS